MTYPPCLPSPADAYASVCRALHTPTRARVMNDLLALSSAPRVFRTEPIDSDAHAVALTAALLASYGTPWSLLCRFVLTYNPLAEPLEDVLMPTAQSELPSQPQLSISEDASSFLYVDFSFYAVLTETAATAVLAACLLLPPHLHVELDLRSCLMLNSLDMSPWDELLDAFPNHASVTSLLLDGCPLNIVPPCTVYRLPHLRLLSMRGTNMRNLWRLSETINALPSLKVALFAGMPGDQLILHRMQSVCRGGEGQHSTHAFANNTAEITAAAKMSNDNNTQGATDADTAQCEFDTRLEDFRKQLEEGSNFVYQGMSQRPFRPQVKDTPATHSRHYRAFLLACRHPTLTWLDGFEITAAEQDVAREQTATRFERTTLLSVERSEDVPPNLVNLLRSRETGTMTTRPPRRGVEAAQTASGSAAAAAASAATTATAAVRNDAHSPHGGKTWRPRKRQRGTDAEVQRTDTGTEDGNGGATTTCADVDVAAAVAAAAGFPDTGRPVSLRADERLRMILAGIEARRGTRLSVSGMVEAAALRGRGDGAAAMAAMAMETATDTEGLTGGGMEGFSQRVFEQRVSKALVERDGAPRIDYLQQAVDRPRQFEYNPAKAGELVYGTALGYLVVMDADSGVVKGSCFVGGGTGNRESGERIERTRDPWDVGSRLAMHDDGGGNEGVGQGGGGSTAVFGLCWMNKREDLFISGSNDGAIHVYNTEWMASGRNGGCVYACETFDKLTSVHMSMNDVRFAVSGENPHVGIFDTERGTLTETMRRCHSDVINVIKFAHHNPFVLLTSSFDRRVRKWDLREHRPGGRRRPIFTTTSSSDTMMACFSPDDDRILVSAVDNEVRQYSASDGRVVLDFDIAKTGSRYNFTRSYYMNERDYIISGSCMENVVRVYNARSGKCLTEVDVDDGFYVQSLRANPSRRFNFSALLVARPAVDALGFEVIANVDLHSRA